MIIINREIVKTAINVITAIAQALKPLSSASKVFIIGAIS